MCGQLSLDVGQGGFRVIDAHLGVFDRLNGGLMGGSGLVVGDERRPRFGLLRSREFIMKDAYSFDADREGLDASYERMREAYENVCDRMGLEYRIVVADAGQIGGDGGTEEFMVLADNGEAELVYCDCGYAADVEAAACTPAPVPYVRAKEGMPAGDVREKVATPGVHTIDELAAFLGIPAAACMKGSGPQW